jgi:hypothetical protein
MKLSAVINTKNDSKEIPKEINGTETAEKNGKIGK